MIINMYISLKAVLVQNGITDFDDFRNYGQISETAAQLDVMKKYFFFHFIKFCYYFSAINS